MKISISKNIIIIIFCIIMLSLISIFLNAPSSKYKDTPILSSFKSYDYTSLKNQASIIALAEPLDSLSKKNSTVTKNENGAITDYFSKRNVKVIKYFKNDIQEAGNKLTILEHAAISDENEYLHPENYNSLEKGDRYILFLMPSYLDGIPIIISAGNGLVNLEDISKNEKLEVSYKAVVEFMSDSLSAEVVDAIVNSKNATSVANASAHIKRKKIHSDICDFDLSYYNAAGKTYIELTYGKVQMIFESQDPTILNTLDTILD